MKKSIPDALSYYRPPLVKMYKCILILASLSLSQSLIHNYKETIPSDSSIYRLTETLTPSFYNLSLSIDPNSDSFSGEVIITFEVSKNLTTDTILLHSDDSFINITSVTLNTDINCTAGSSNTVGIVTVNCSEGVEGSNNILRIHYVASFSSDGRGIIKRTYIDQGKEETLVESVFEPIYARRAFPCFDEPELRANFSIEVMYPSEYTVISNSPLSRTTSNSITLSIAEFVVTPKIPTYLVTILISKLQQANIESGDDLQFKVFTRADVANLTKTVGNYYSQILGKLGSYTELPYLSIGDSECYQVAIPDYSDGIGGFGVFKYREDNLLDDGEKTTKRATQNIILNIAYKLLHEWFGGDLSVNWWSDVWITEAIATYVAYSVANEIDDSFDFDKQFLVEVTQKAMHTDAYPFAQALSTNESTVDLNDNITNTLNGFSYQKGLAL
ncbi:hypothetical protein NQ317_015853 [Molorchus minor]|uniref:Peptidase M1 membrane alanine aminopeptidase domain-containing protein n=1 Tax=Molorchus minor TaxID=1323400 RepID=A0ABQ9J836_9CUCU|nr:hypothetical protein NQ317_015853 [Molorchus minor]